MKNFRRVISLLLVLVMVLSLAPVELVNAANDTGSGFTDIMDDDGSDRDGPGADGVDAPDHVSTPSEPDLDTGNGVSNSGNDEGRHPESGDGFIDIGDDDGSNPDGPGAGESSAKYSVSLNYDSSRGTVIVSHKEAAEGDRVTVLVIPTDEDFVVSKFVVTDLVGTEIEATESETDESWSFVMPNQGVNVSVEFISISEWMENNPDEGRPNTLVNYADCAVLYADGTLVFQRGSAPIGGGLHGSVVQVWTNCLMKSYTKGTAPWFSSRQAIKSVEFEDRVRVSDTSYWFMIAII